MSELLSEPFPRGDRRLAPVPNHAAAEVPPRPGSATAPRAGGDFREVLAQDAGRSKTRAPKKAVESGVKNEEGVATPDPVAVRGDDRGEGGPIDAGIAIADRHNAADNSSPGLRMEGARPQDARSLVSKSRDPAGTGNEEPASRRLTLAPGHGTGDHRAGNVLPAVDRAENAFSGQSRESVTGMSPANGRDYLPARDAVPAPASMTTDDAPAISGADAKSIRMFVPGGTGASGPDLSLPESIPQEAPYRVTNETTANPQRTHSEAVRPESRSGTRSLFAMTLQTPGDAVPGRARAGLKLGDVPVSRGQTMTGGQDRAPNLPVAMPVPALAGVSTVHARSTAESRAATPSVAGKAPNAPETGHQPSGRGELAGQPQRLAFVAREGLGSGASRPAVRAEYRHPAEGARGLARTASTPIPGKTEANALHPPPRQDIRVSTTGGAAGSGPVVTVPDDPVATVRSSVLTADPEKSPEPRALSPAEAMQPGRSGPVPVPTQTAGADTARGAVWQIASAVQAGGERSFDLSLNPAELGKVRISLTAGESGMTVIIQADRPETLDLLRRHADSLGQDFRDMGYGSTSFTFEDGSQTPRNGGQDSVNGDVAASGVPGEPTVPETNETGHAATAPGRVDIRL